MSNINNNLPFRVCNRLEPEKYPQGLLEPIDLSAVTFLKLSLSDILFTKMMTKLQTVFIDNALNPEPFSLFSYDTQQNITAPPFSQGYYVLFYNDGSPGNFLCSSTGGVVTTLIFSNVYVEPMFWIVTNSDLEVGTLPSAKGGIANESNSGVSGFYTISNKQLIKAGATSLYGLALWNNGIVNTFLQVFDAATTAAVTLGTTPPNYSFQVGANNSWEEKFAGESRLAFNNGLVLAATTTAAGGTVTSTALTGNIYAE